MNSDNSSTIPAANGQAYRAYLETTLAVLEPLSVADFYTSPMPSPVDDTLAEIVSAYTAWPSPIRKQFLAQLPAAKRGLFGIFGHRAATLAVRQNDAERLRLGLIGNAIANSPIPPRRNVDSALAVFHHCARVLGLDPQALFSDVAHFSTDDMAATLEGFGRRTDVTLNQFGWREIKTPEGVRFKVEW